MGYYCYSKKIIGWQQNVAEYITQRESLWGIDTSANHPALLHWQFKYHAFKNDPQFKRSAHIHQRWAQNNQSHKARPRENFMWNTFIFPQHLTTVAFWRRLHIFFLVVVHSVVSDSLRPHGLQHTRLPCPSLSPGVCSNSCPLNQWRHPTISSSVIPFSLCHQSFPASGFFLLSWLLTSGGQSMPAEWSGLTSFRIHWFDLLAIQGTLKNLLQTTVGKHQHLPPTKLPFPWNQQLEVDMEQQTGSK